MLYRSREHYHQPQAGLPNWTQRACLVMVAIMLCGASVPVSALPAVLVQNINQAPSVPQGSQASNFVAVGRSVFFIADDGMTGQELWKTDGSTAGTQLVRDIRPGDASSAPGNLVSLAGKLYFSADDGTHGRELWESDGTLAGTVLVGDIDPGAEGSDPTELVVLDRSLIFTALDDSHGSELWRSDGTTDGTQIIDDILPVLPVSRQRD